MEVLKRRRDAKSLNSLLREKGYHVSPYTYAGRVSETFGLAMPIIPDYGRILDMGCSKGATTRELAQIYPDCTVIGIDISQEAITHARQINEWIRKGPDYLTRNAKERALPEVFVKANGFAKPFPDGCFDAVFCMNNICQVVDKADEMALTAGLKKITAMAKEGGYVIFSNFDDYIMTIRRGEKVEEYASNVAPLKNSAKNLRKLYTIMRHINST